MKYQEFHVAFNSAIFFFYPSKGFVKMKTKMFGFNSISKLQSASLETLEICTLVEMFSGKF